MKISPITAPAATSAPTEAPRPDIRRIMMKTNASPTVVEQVLATESVKTDESVQAEAAEDTKPLSPKFAALVRKERALQVKERELADREKALQSNGATEGASDLIARLKSKPLSVLQEFGVTYDQLTEAILSNQDGVNPEVLALKEEVRALKEGIDKNFTDRDTAAEQQVLAEIKRDAESIVAQDDTFEAIKKRNGIPVVLELIKRTYKEQGEVLDTMDALQAVEDELIEDSLRLADIGKVRSRLAPPLALPADTRRPNTIRTLTNRDSSGVMPSRRERAIMAMNGTLTK